MKKPEKMVSMPGYYGTPYADGYNAACDKWEAWLKKQGGTYKKSVRVRKKVPND